MKLIKYRDRKKEWRWRIVARNGRKLAHGGEGYKRQADMNKALRQLRQGFVNSVTLD